MKYQHLPDVNRRGSPVNGAVLMLAVGCRLEEYVPAEVPKESVDTAEATTSGPCTPALSLAPEKAVSLPYHLLQFQASGGTGEYVYEIAAGEGTVGAANGAYVSGGTPGLTDTVRVTDRGCTGEAIALVQIVETATLQPDNALVSPGTRIAYAWSGGSGDFDCSLLKNGSGATLNADCSYLAGPSEGSDQLLFSDRQTGQDLYASVEVRAGTSFAVEGQGHLFLPLDSRFVPKPLWGSGEVEVRVVSGDLGTDGEGILASVVGSGSVAVRDRYIDAEVTIPVEVMAPLSPEGSRDGERSLAGVMRGLGDVNGDGYADAAFAFIEPSVGAYYGGMVAVYSGGPQGLSADPVQVYSGTTPQETLGRDVARGDVNGDGQIDLLIGADKTDRGGTNNGAVRIYYGIPGSFFSAVPDRSLYGELSYDRMGASIALCDFDADGYLDLATGAIDETNLATALPADEQGAIHIFHGSASGYPDLADFILYGMLPDQDGVWQNIPALHMGTTLAAGDVDGDGLCDLVAGTPELGLDGGLEDGVMVVYRGTTDNNLVLERTPAVVYTGNEGAAGDFGRRISVADVDGDGSEDVAVSAWNDSSRHTDGGVVYIFSGGPLYGIRRPEDASWVMYGAEDDHLGADLQLVDLQGTGEVNLLTSAFRRSEGATENGEVLVYGGLSLTGVDASDEDPLSRWSGGGDAFRLGQVVAALGDVDRDGTGDIFAFAGYDDQYGVQVGAPWYISGADGAAERLALPGTAAGHQIGQGLAFFDMDADGKRDLLVGGPGIGVEGTGANSGALFAYAGEDGGFSDASEEILGGHPSHSGSDYFGWDLSTAGDFDGDGYEDLAVVARKDSRPNSFGSDYSQGEDCSGTLSQAGSLLVYRGGKNGISTEPSFISFGIGESEYIYEVQGGFDHNGDGYDDLVIGSYTWALEAGGFAILYGRPSEDGIQVMCERDEYHGAELYDFLGSSFASLGDLDGDGCDEVAVGASGEEYSEDYFDQGVIRVLWGWGGPGCRSAREVTTLAMKEVSAQAGTSLAGGQDVDGDGLPDLLVGAAAHRQAYAEVGAVWMAPGWYLLSLPTDTATDTALPELDETQYSILLPDDGRNANLSIVGPVAGDRLGDSLAFIQDPLDPGRSAVVAGLPLGDYGGTPLEGGVGIWRFDTGTRAFDLAPWAIVGGESGLINGELGAEVIGEGGTIAVAAPLADTYGEMDVGAVYVAHFPD